MLRHVWNLIVRREEPFSLVHFVTNRCTARCPHCFLDFQDPRAFEGDLTLEEVRELSRRVGPALFNVNLTGGEPFLRPDLWEIAEAWLTNPGVRSLYLTSNGGLVEAVGRFLEAFQGSRYSRDRRIAFSFSIDDFAEEHDRKRGVPGLFSRALESHDRVRRAATANAMANIGITVTDHNHERVVALYEHLKAEHGVRAVTATLMREAGVVRALAPEVKARILSAYVELSRRIAEDMGSGRLQGFVGGLQGRLMNAKQQIMQTILQRTYLDPHFESWCPAASTFGVIAHDGTVYPCEILDRPLGNLRDHGMDLRALWRQPAASGARREIRQVRCHCTYECAWTVNILSNPRYLPGLALGALGLPPGGRPRAFKKGQRAGRRVEP